MLGYWGDGVMGWNIGLLEWWNGGMLGNWADGLMLFWRPEGLLGCQQQIATLNT